MEARKGARVYLACRDERKASEAIRELEKDEKIIENGELRFLRLDLADFASAKRAGAEILTKEGRLDILVNNASLLVSETPEYINGILDYMAVNHFGPFIFTQALLPLLKKTSSLPGSDVRVVFVSSDAHKRVPQTIRFKTLEELNVDYTSVSWDYYARYCASKFANVLYAKELQRRLSREKSPISVLSLHPGNVNTFASSTPCPRFASLIMPWIFMSPDVGSYTTLFAAASPLIKEQPEAFRGAYLKPIAQLGKASDNAEREDLGAELWETTENVLKQSVYHHSKPTFHRTQLTPDISRRR
ncbi:hypothetical protein MD484_g5353, partial [Candolleomyces efflorescens]